MIRYKVFYINDELIIVRNSRMRRLKSVVYITATGEKNIIRVIDKMRFVVFYSTQKTYLFPRNTGFSDNIFITKLLERTLKTLSFRGSFIC